MHMPENHYARDDAAPCIDCHTTEFPCICFTRVQAISFAINECDKYDEWDCHGDVAGGAYAEWQAKRAVVPFQQMFPGTAHRHTMMALYWFYQNTLNS